MKNIFLRWTPTPRSIWKSIWVSICILPKKQKIWKMSFYFLYFNFTADSFDFLMSYFETKFLGGSSPKTIFRKSNSNLGSCWVFENINSMVKIFFLASKSHLCQILQIFLTNIFRFSVKTLQKICVCSFENLYEIKYLSLRFKENKMLHYVEGWEIYRDLIFFLEVNADTLNYRAPCYFLETELLEKNCLFF
jgi:hypothetical protein